MGGSFSRGATAMLPMALTSSGSPKRQSLTALVFFFLALASREAFRYLPPAIATQSWKVSWILFCLIGLWIAYRMGLRAAIAELGLAGSAARGLGLAFVASLPMLVTLFFVRKGAIHFSAETMLSSVVLAAVTEEVLFRGYLFRQLYRRAGWRFVPAVLVTGMLFGLAHISTALRGGAMEVVGVVVITTLGGAFFAGLFVRWNDNLWVPIGMHLFMNAWWELFAVSPSAIGNWGANGARALAIVTAIGLTLRFTKRAHPGAQP